MTWSRHRLRTPEQFRTATRRGARAARSHVVAHLVIRTDGEPGPRVGFVVSKKVGNSVVRNRVARRLREIFRSELASLPAGSDVVLRALPGIQDLPFSALEEEVRGAMRSAARKAEQRSAAGTPSAGSTNAVQSSTRASISGQEGAGRESSGPTNAGQSTTAARERSAAQKPGAS
ncbi:ribonuclease P protein component [Brachybacterium sp. JHP9]|uniref:Ribonuclease P protein component n=1 Tax=Brachybacterium equifaecis TaxID=2910770 RepID=A0ABT0R255_9MICO|nr:ribonuclease P protein component [Brachybacterium equifaecis]MCL6424018.1 ribonuclease P protein component [Brachybacterium equifaecis]